MYLRYTAFLLLGIAAIRAHAQAIPAGTIPGDIQVGVGYLNSNPDYSPHRFNGFGIFADADLWKHFGVEVAFDHTSGAVPTTITENTYEGGLRYRYPIRNFSPYIKILAGGGHFSFGSSSQTGTYGMYAGGGGIDYGLTGHIVLRGDYEYQRWGNFPPHGLQPNIFLAGVAYRFH